MNFREAVAAASTESQSLNFSYSPRNRSDVLGNETLFHIPLIALTIVLLARSQAKPKRNDIGMLVGQCFEQSIASFKGSTQELGWSANLRVRTVKALTFLEDAGMVVVHKHNSRIDATEPGKKFIDKVLNEESHLCVALLTIKRSYRNICKERDIEAKLDEI
ncbi:hypothetical protein ACET4R_22345 [Pseudomonas aeruginosa]|uniref:hypothetical protein n=1 Tax=Pseudomonas aeruginosa TaxID=287 RepID=UPI0009A26824|nr:hypothetical protein [Pseudomonas aeruginosa]MBI7342665.1 hypothetical protein [Pseudomonas aeruginosa]MBI7456208.1 hypothetical protein [Pseudomonas aeruginosa]MBI7485822.1 hypothetical protein [Pseudomonas aeruginosa]MBI8462628.1 hypothetical protein [Pseudomonas aeruginosa]MBI8486057.1 hypothetical protein [Pseudomonas aeruginosa]